MSKIINTGVKLQFALDTHEVFAYVEMSPQGCIMYRIITTWHEPALVVPMQGEGIINFIGAVQIASKYSDYEVAERMFLKTLGVKPRAIQY